MTRIEALADIALQAGAVIMDIYGTEFAVAIKSDESPVTAADQAAEAVILAGLARLDPGRPVVAEEAMAAGAEAVTGPAFYMVDPLDGTKEFVSRNGEFTVNIALVEHGVPVAGVVYAPALGRLYAGAEGQGAWRAKVTDGGSLGPAEPIRTRPVPEKGLAVVASRSHAGAETTELLSRLPVAEFHAAGSSLKFCLLAEGSADFYPRLGPTMEWDTAAGDAVLRAAGGLVVTRDGAPMVYGRRDDDFRNPWFLAVGNASILRSVLAVS
ncbi:3'(2'),5'-bisphosphate nucleotidase CysQ [Chthonobacter albigriseus]|uniref:3'(2'),5'-bisphosphate nucleotidase CysQ n=1 Tax=Chthonobacter albigriseus TaxID=1683161 RepID=UPI0015EE6FE4|nr:3'(2'),5'-bisphosphate nucleotidase CysQ [Chthonobacter albigriseus]